MILLHQQLYHNGVHKFGKTLQSIGHNKERNLAAASIQHCLLLDSTRAPDAEW